jgi:predicted anti-sigma-YlaC factor YlaD
MSDNNLHKIFANTACVSTEMMMDYLDGKLSEKEKNKVEVHIASCEMCRDEFEGLSLLEDKSKTCCNYN